MSIDVDLGRNESLLEGEGEEQKENEHFMHIKLIIVTIQLALFEGLSLTGNQTLTRYFQRYRPFRLLHCQSSCPQPENIFSHLDLLV